MCRILEASGSEESLLLLVTIFMTDISDWAAIDAAFGAHLGAHRPARSMIPIGTPLHLGYRVGVQAVAAVRAPDTH